MDDYIEYQIAHGEGEFGSSSDDSSGGCLILILIIIAAIWFIVKLIG